MGKLIEIFGKESGIRRSDVEKSIIENSLEESINTEYKCLEKVNDMNKENIEGHVIKPLISFLNRIEKESSLLILGIRTEKHKPSYIIPAKRELITEEKLRKWITNYISSIPRYKTFPSFRIIEIECHPNESIFLIEINPFEDVLYYSRISDSSYIRRGSESVKLTIPEIVVLINSKKYAKLNLIFINKKYEKIENAQKNKINADIICKNDGVIPASNVTGILSFNIIKGDKKDISISLPLKLIDLSELNPKNFKTCRFKLTELVYPGIDITLGGIEIAFSNENEISLVAISYDNDGKTQQDFVINKKGIRETLSEHSTYVS